MEFTDFALAATALKVVLALSTVVGLILILAHLDHRARKPFSATIERIMSEPVAAAIYFGMRFIGSALLLGLLMGCSAAPAAAGPLIPDKYDGRIQAAVATWWGDYPHWRAWKAQLYQESRLDPAAVSPVGARGLAQMMPGTWDDLRRELRLGSLSPHHEVAIEAGAYYQAKLRRAWSAPRPALDRNQLGQASYNAGMGNLIKAQKLCGGRALYAEIIPCLEAVTGPKNSHETRTYVQRIARYWAMLEAGA